MGKIHHFDGMKPRKDRTFSWAFAVSFREKLFETTELHPPKQTWNLKMDPWKFGDSYWFHHHFQVPAVNFWGCMLGGETSGKPHEAVVDRWLGNPQGFNLEMMVKPGPESPFPSKGPAPIFRCKMFVLGGCILAILRFGDLFGMVSENVTLLNGCW